MRISMVSVDASPLAAIGGLDACGRSVYVAALATALARRGHHVTVYTRRDVPGLPDRVEISPRFELVHLTAGPTEQLPEEELLTHLADLADGLGVDWLRSKPDIVHSHLWTSGIAAIDAARRIGAPRDIPVAQTFHGLGVVSHRNGATAETSPPDREWLEPWVARNVDSVIGTCTDEAFELKSLGIPTGAISVVPCGVDLRRFGTSGEIEERARPLRLVTVGRLQPSNRFDLVIQAFARLVDEGVDAELIIVGGAVGAHAGDSDPATAMLRTLARELGVADRVELRGPLEHASMPAILRSANAVICAPRHGTSGVVALEAMACGIPVVASGVGGLIDTVIDGITGVHVPPQDAEAIATALSCLLADDGRMASLGVAGSRRVAARFTWEQVAIDTERAYRKTARRAKERVIARASEGATR
ncbi:glycosyltransferase [Marisediminicola antarctica]|uniref:Glycosyl transferase n=1 Tax=Marisediminicola antarctica TaxID=674079 RepID=A0A7L5AHF7_9MICO|nr:glycosyltransferase [Marisediminicola antarctica]QHO69737.1 glycosyl transferase [Marisediminicola antarctica]